MKSVILCVTSLLFHGLPGPSQFSVSHVIASSLSGYRLWLPVRLAQAREERLEGGKVLLDSSFGATGLGRGPNADSVSMEVLLWSSGLPTANCLCPQFPGERWWHPELMGCDHPRAWLLGFTLVVGRLILNTAHLMPQGSLLVLGKHA